MMTNFTFKTSVLTILCFLTLNSVFAQKPVQSSKWKASALKESSKDPILHDGNEDPVETISAIDTVMMMEKTSNAFHIRINPKEGATVWRHRLLGDLPEDAVVEENMWTTGLSVDTCCMTLDNLDAQTGYVLQFGRISDETPEPAVWYSMVDTTRCMGIPLDQIQLIGLNHSSATMMCHMDATSFEWVLHKIGSSTAKHIETNSNSIEWTNLPANTAYECRVRYMCGGIWSDYSSADIFTTSEYEEVMCETLKNNQVYTSNISTNDVELNCDMTGDQYSYGMRLSGTETWTIVNSKSKKYKWLNLKPGKTYEYKVKVECQSAAWTNWSSTHYFKTKEESNYTCKSPGSHHMAVKNITYNSASTYCAMDGHEYHWALKPHGSGSWKEHSTSNSYQHWTGLKYNTKYEYKVKVKCYGGSWTGWSGSYHFTTKDHYGNTCSTPLSHQMKVKDLTYHSAITHCAVDGYEYHWSMREHGSNHWLDYSSHKNFYSWTNLKYKTKYEYKVKVKCHNGHWTGWSAGYWFTTPDHYGSCSTPKSHHMSVKDLTYNSASTHCAVDGYEYHWMLKPHGSSTWFDHSSTYNYHHWTGLQYNTKYEYKVKVKCHGGIWTGWSNSYWFTTPNHYGSNCSTPQSHHMSVKDLTYNSASTHCSMDGYEYHWSLKESGSTAWKDHSSSNPHYNWTNLKHKTKYEYKVKVKCYGGHWTGWSASYWFTTPDHYGSSCTTPKSQHMSVKDVTYNAATTHCSVDGYEYHWALRAHGSKSWMDYSDSKNHYKWNNLHYNTKYEYRVKVKCHNGTWTGWSSIYWFTTPNHYGGCNKAQSHHLSVKNVTYNSASTHCSVEGYEYHWSIRPHGGYGWSDHQSSYNYHNWTNLKHNSKYEYKVKIKCHNGSWTDWSDIYWFSTHDHYNECSTPGSHHMSVKDLTYNSASTHCGVSGYEYHWMLKEHGSTNWQDHVSSQNHHNWKNLHYNKKYEYKVKVKCHSGKWTGWSGSYYFTTHNHSGYGCSAPSSSEFKAQQQAYNIFRIYLYAPFTSWTSQIRVFGNYEWSGHTTSANNMGWGNLHPDTKYEYRVKRSCADGSQSDWSIIKTFWTGAGSEISSGRPSGNVPLVFGTTGSHSNALKMSEDNTLEIFPNPASSQVSIVGIPENSEVVLVDMQGKVVIRKVLSESDYLDIHTLDNGIYQVMMVDSNGQLQTKRLAVLK